MGIGVDVWQFHLELFCNSVGTYFTHMGYPMPQIVSNGNLSAQLDSVFLPNLKSLGVQMGIGVHLLEFQLEQFGIP